MHTFMNIIRANERHYEDMGWLKTSWLFSFDRYYDPENLQFGNLRVFNDDYVAPRSGFPKHPHANMEIVTIVLEGEITHEDSMGTKSTISAGEVQWMAAGSGVVHSEFNHSSAPLHLYQIWLSPRMPGAQPAYADKMFSPEERKNKLLAVVSGLGHEGALEMDADASIYIANFEAGKNVEYAVKDARGAFIYITSGNVTVNGERLSKNDQARIDEKGMVVVQAIDAASFVLIDVSLAVR